MWRAGRSEKEEGGRGWNTPKPSFFLWLEGLETRAVTCLRVHKAQVDVLPKVTFRRGAWGLAVALAPWKGGPQTLHQGRPLGFQVEHRDPGV